MGSLSARLLGRAAAVTATGAMVLAGVLTVTIPANAATGDVPAAPTNLAVEGDACTAEPIYVGPFLPEVGFVMSATVSDSDNEAVGGQFVFWPQGQPSQRTELDSITGLSSGSTVKVTATSAQLADNTTYVLRVRGTDGSGTGPWSSVCRFTTDFAQPAAPTITSATYTSGTAGGGSGEPGQFTFNGNGDPNVVGFYYTDESQAPVYVPADKDGGTASIVDTPSKVGPHTLTAWSVSRAGGYSAQTSFSYLVANNAPLISCTPDSAYVGVARQCTFSPRGIGGATGYAYSFDGGPTTTVAAGTDGTATVSVTPLNDETLQELTAQTKLTNGNLSDTALQTFQFLDSTPGLTQSASTITLGQSVTFTLTAVLPGSNSFTYAENDGNLQTVPVDADGTATLTLTPSEDGEFELDVYSTTAAGAQSDVATAFVTVNDPS